MNLSTNNRIGYLNLKTGAYKYVPVVSVNVDGTITLIEKVRTGWQAFRDNVYNERVADVLRFAETPSRDFKDGRPLIKLI